MSLEGIRINGQNSQFRNMSDFKYLQPRFSHVLQIPIIQMHDSCNHETFIVTAGKAYLIDIQLRFCHSRAVDVKLMKVHQLR